MNQCFTTVVEDILGRTVKEEIFQLLERNGIKPTEISSRFDDVIEVLTRVFGNNTRVLVHMTVSELYKEYSLRTGFAFGESLKEQIALLREKVVNELLDPNTILASTLDLDHLKESAQAPPILHFQKLPRQTGKSRTLPARVLSSPGAMSRLSWRDAGLSFSGFVRASL
jgi:hypothetical protein